MKRTYRTSTALVASLSLMLPYGSAIAQAQGASGGSDAAGPFICLDGATPPCAQEPQEGTPLLDLPVEALQALAAEDRLDPALLAEYGLSIELLRDGSEKDVREALKEARKAESEAAKAAAKSDAADAEVEATAEAAEMEAEVEATSNEAALAEAELQAQADAEAAAAAAAETAAQEAADKDAREAELQAELEASAAAEAQAEAEAQAAAEAAEAEAAEQEAADEAALEAEKQAALDATAAAEAQAAADAEAAKQDAADKAAREAEMQAELEAAAQAEAAASAEAEAPAEAAATAEAEAPVEANAADQDAADEEALKAARAAEMQAELVAAAEAEAASEAGDDAVAEGQDAEPLLTEEERAARRAERAERRAERRADDEQEEVDPTAEEPQQEIAAAASADAGEATVVETEIDESNSRQSDEEFAAAVSAEAGAAAKSDDDDGLSNFQKALLLGIGAVAVGSLLNNNREVVANTGDRVVVEGDNGLEIYRDDDALLRQPGADLRTETFSDGSSRSTLTREDGTQVVTIRNAQGQVLRRSRIFADGTEVELFDDLAQSDPVDVRSLRELEPAPITLSAAESDRAALLEALRAEQAVDTGRSYSLRQVREIEAVRALVPAIDLDTLTFASGSAALRPEQAATLVDLGLTIEDRLAENPREVFLIEGHTDAVGNDAFNLALSDRRAETVALALTENFNIPPENLVVQGYGERFLKVQTETDEQANRRASVRRITPLLQQVASAQ